MSARPLRAIRADTLARLPECPIALPTKRGPGMPLAASYAFPLCLPSEAFSVHRAGSLTDASRTRASLFIDEGTADSSR
eukprot:815606-Pyramimonas_sp.AAC.1